MDLGDVIRELREPSEPVPKPLRLPTPQEVDRVQRKLGEEQGLSLRSP